MNGRKFASVAGTVTVASIAAYASYEHMRALSLHAGQTPSIAALLPLSVDGLVIVASVAIVDGRQRKGSAWCAFVLGVVVSLVANVLAAGPTLTDRCVSAWPSVALLATVEVIARGGRKAVPASTGDDSVLERSDLGTPVVTVTPAATVTPPRPSGKRPPATTSAAKVAAVAKRMPAATAATIAVKAGVSESTARRHMRDLAALAVPSPTEAVPATTNGHDVLNGAAS